MINVWIDDLVPCLKNSQTGDFVETEVVQIKRKSFLEKFNKRTGWHTNWTDLLKENEIYALVIKGTVDIQGLVAVTPDYESEAEYITWMVAAPENVGNKKKYIGVGGHLFAIAIDKSIDNHFDGFVFGFAANENLLTHYIHKFNAQYSPINHPYQFFIDDESAKKIKEVYTYEWSNEQL